VPTKNNYYKTPLKMKKSMIFQLVLALFFALPVISIAQHVEFDKNVFKDKKDEFKEAKKSLDEGDKLFTNQPFPLYPQALEAYLKANAFNPNNGDLNYKIGICYLNSNMKFKALEYFEKAYKLKPTVSPDIQFYIGRGSQLAQEWDKAIKAYEAYKNSLNTKTDMPRIMAVSKHIEECRHAKKLVAKPVRVWIDNLGPNVNSQYPDYGMIMNADASEIYFTSRRPNTTGGGKDEFINEYFEDIYKSKKEGKDYTPAENAGPPLNTKGHDATVALSPDGSKMLIYIDDKGDGNIYESVRKGDTWSKPKKLNSEICSPYHEPSAWYSPDMRKLYFVSDRPLSGKGEPKDKDIYVATWNPKKEIWDNVTRLPETINTRYDEDGIFLHPDGKTLYFSSNGHNTMGGYDIFYSVLQDDGSWSTPVNLGYPINTPDDDVFFVVAANGKHAYMTSFRENGFGEKDLYKVTFLGEEKQPMLNTEEILLAGSGVPTREKVIEPKIEIRKSSLSLLKGTIRDAKTKKPLFAMIEVIDNEKNEVVAEFTSDEVTGRYMVSLPAGKNYGIAVKADGYLFHSENFDIPKESDYQEYTKDVDMKKVEVGEVIVLRNIFFDLNKYSLRPESKNELERLTKLLKDNPTIRIQIGGHTDSRGSAAYNKELSHNRAKAVVDYLIANGIDGKRLEYQGYGKEQPMITDEEIAKMRLERDKEDAHQMNRRTEFKIISAK
jgi:outer membrane protein OmpA-like peptidoglycan-associated protein/tetratricopeptide (TPR) repeat protein